MTNRELMKAKAGKPVVPVGQKQLTTIIEQVQDRHHVAIDKLQQALTAPKSPDEKKPLVATWAVCEAMLRRDLNTWPGVTPTSAAVHITAKEVVAAMMDGSLRLDAKSVSMLVGANSPAGKRAPLETAILRQELLEAWKDKPALAEARDQLVKIDQEACRAILQDAIVRAPHCELNDQQKACVIAAFKTAGDAGHYQEVCDFVQIMSQHRPDSPLTKDAAQILRSGCQSLCQNGPPDKAVSMCLTLYAQPNNGLANFGKEMARELIANNKATDAALHLHPSFLRHLGTLGQLAAESSPDKLESEMNQKIAKRLDDAANFADQRVAAGLTARPAWMPTPEPGKPDTAEMTAAAVASGNRSLQNAMLDCHQRNVRFAVEKGLDLSTKLAKAQRAANDALAHGGEEAVLDFVSDLAEIPHPQALMAAAQIVQSDAFARAFAANPVEVAKGAAPQPGEEWASAVMAINEACQRGKVPFIFSAADVQKAAMVMHDLGDEQESLRGLDLLCKMAQQDPRVEATVATTANNLAAATTVTRPAYAEEEFYEGSDVADDLMRQAKVLQTLQAYYPQHSINGANALRDKAVEAAAQAIADGDFEAALSYARVVEAVTPEANIPALHKSLAEALMAKARELGAEIAGLDDAERATAMALSLDAARAALKVAARNGALNTQMLGEAEALRKQWIKTLQSNAMDVDGNIKKQLQDVAAGDRQTELLAGELNDLIDQAEKTQQALANTKKFVGTALANNVGRYVGELNTGCPDVRTNCYTSGAQASSDDADKTQSFALSASVAVQSAYSDLVSADFTKWDPSQTHLKSLKDLHEQWNKAEAAVHNLTPQPAQPEIVAEAVYHDLHRLEKATLPPSVDDDDELKDLRKTWENTKPSEEKFLAARAEKRARPSEWKQTQEAAAKIADTLSMKAGYLLEERLYQLLPNHQRQPWTSQDRTLFPGNSEGKKSFPDVVQSFDGNHHVCLDLTAAKSSGHIFKKADAWLHPKVTAAIEIMYPSLDKATLKQCLIKGAKLDLEAIRLARERSDQLTQMRIDAGDIRKGLVDLTPKKDQKALGKEFDKLDAWINSNEVTEMPTEAKEQFDKLIIKATKAAMDEQLDGEVVPHGLRRMLPDSAQEAQKLLDQLIEQDDRLVEQRSLAKDIAKKEKQIADKEKVVKKDPSAVGTKQLLEADKKLLAEYREEKLALDKAVADDKSKRPALEKNLKIAQKAAGKDIEAIRAARVTRNAVAVV